MLWDKEYYGTNVHPYETIFLKSNRGIDLVGLERLSEWTRGGVTVVITSALKPPIDVAEYFFARLP